MSESKSPSNTVASGALPSHPPNSASMRLFSRSPTTLDAAPAHWSACAVDHASGAPEPSSRWSLRQPPPPRSCRSSQAQVRSIFATCGRNAARGSGSAKTVASASGLKTKALPTSYVHDRVSRRRMLHGEGPSLDAASYEGPSRPHENLLARRPSAILALRLKKDVERARTELQIRRFDAVAVAVAVAADFVARRERVDLVARRADGGVRCERVRDACRVGRLAHRVVRELAAELVSRNLKRSLQCKGHGH